MNKAVVLLFIFLAYCSFSNAMAVTDEFVNSTLKDRVLEKPEPNLNYDYNSTDRLVIKLSALDEISSESKIYEGMPFRFSVLTNVYYDGRLIIKKGTEVPARVETIIKSGMNGIPASIILGGFKIDNISKGQMSDFYEVKGQDRSLWVFPLKWALTPLPPTGSLTNFIKGGHAKIEKNDIIEIYYYPNWQKKQPEDII